MSIPEKPTGPASYFPSIEKKYGHPISHWINLLKGQKDMKHMELVSWLKTVHQIGHGHANALVAHLKSNPESQLSRSSEKLQPAVHPLQPVIPMSQPVVHSYLFFSGNCAEALEFYKTALGAGIEMVMRFNESPDPPPPGMLAPGFEDKVMHASFRVGASQIMASDCCDNTGKFDGFSLSLVLATEAEANRYFAALSEGGKVTMPLGRTFWSPCFGMLEDKFGVGWMFNVVPSPEAGAGV